MTVDRRDSEDLYSYIRRLAQQNGGQGAEQCRRCHQRDDLLRLFKAHFCTIIEFKHSQMRTLVDQVNALHCQEQVLQLQLGVTETENNDTNNKIKVLLELVNGLRETAKSESFKVAKLTEELQKTQQELMEAKQSSFQKLWRRIRSKRNKSGKKSVQKTRNSLFICFRK